LINRFVEFLNRMGVMEVLQRFASGVKILTQQKSVVPKCLRIKRRVFARWRQARVFTQDQKSCNTSSALASPACANACGKLVDSWCKDRWVAIRHGNKVCFAQWEDVGPFQTDHWQYVFGNERPRPNKNSG
jgi:hypothetical protein